MCSRTLKKKIAQLTDETRALKDKLETAMRD